MGCQSSKASREHVGMAFPHTQSAKFPKLRLHQQQQQQRQQFDLDSTTLPPDFEDHESFQHHLNQQRRSSRRHHSFRNSEYAINCILHGDEDVQVTAIMSDWDVRRIARAMASSSSRLRSLTIELELGEECNQDTVSALIAGIRHCPSLQDIHVIGTGDCGALAFGTLLESRRHGTALRSVNLSNGTKITRTGLKTLSRGLRAGSTVRRLTLASSHLGDDDVSALVAQNDDEFNFEIDELDLSSNVITNKGCKILADALTAPRALTLRNNRISDIECLSSLFSLKVLRLGRNHLGDDLYPLLDLLQFGQLEVLELNHNQITSVGMAVLARGLRRSKSLRTLVVSNNPIGDEGARLLCAMLPNSVENLVMKACDLGPASAPYLATMLQRTTSLKQLVLAENKLGNEGVLVLARDGIAVNAYLEHLVLERDQGGLSDVGPLLDACRYHRAVRSVDVRGTLITEKQQELLAALLQRLHCRQAQLMTMLCSALDIPRLVLGGRAVRTSTLRLVSLNDLPLSEDADETLIVPVPRRTRTNSVLTALPVEMLRLLNIMLYGY